MGIVPVCHACSLLYLLSLNQRPVRAGSGKRSSHRRPRKGSGNPGRLHPPSGRCAALQAVGRSEMVSGSRAWLPCVVHRRMVVRLWRSGRCGRWMCGSSTRPVCGVPLKSSAAEVHRQCVEPQHRTRQSASDVAFAVSVPPEYAHVRRSYGIQARNGIPVQPVLARKRGQCLPSHPARPPPR